MNDVLACRVDDFLTLHAMATEGTRILALVSGGADSTCLMHLLADLRPGQVGVLAVDHGLRPESVGEVASVADSAKRLGLPVWIERLGLPPGAALQARARDGRLAAARRIAREHGFGRIATGHTESDQAETVLFRIARGTGRTGALGMTPVAGDIVRPLLCLSAAETRAWCAERDLAFVDDPSNVDRRFARARVRHDLLPALEAVHPGSGAAVARFADQLRDEAQVLDAVVDEAWARCGHAGGLDVAALAAEHPAVARILVRRLITDTGLSVDARWIARGLELACSGGRPIQVPGGLIAVDRGVMVAERHPDRTAPAVVELTVPGSVRFGDRIVRATRAAAPAPMATRVALEVTGPLVVRSPLPGDRVSLAGGGRQAVGRLLAAAGVPARHRPNVPVVVAGGHVVWVGGYRADPNLLAAPDAQATVLEVIDA